MVDSALRLAWFTPLRPVESGISQYSEDLLPVLARAWQIDVFVDGYRPTHLRESDNLRVRMAREFRAAHRARPYDAVVYQMGNNPYHAYMYDLAREVPGVLVLHDTVLHHLRVGMLLRGRGAPRYRAEMERRYGRAGWEAATRVLRGQMPSALFQFPLSEELIEASRVVAVHSEYSRAQVLSWCPDAQVLRIPMGVPLPPEIPREEARRRLSLPEDQFVVGSVTFINPYKRLDVVMQAVRRLREFVPARLVLAGNVSHMVPLERLIGMFGLEQAADHLGYVDDATARLVVAASDVCVNLRWPTAGETSASLLRTMGAGRPVLVTDGGSFAEIPDGAVVKVPPDVLEQETVFALLRALAEQPELRERVGRLARDFVAREHSLAAAARGYAAAIEAAIGRPVPVPPGGTEPEQIDLPATEPPTRTDPLAGAVAQALVDLGIGADTRLVASVARSMAEIGLAPGKMGSTGTEPVGGKEGRRGVERSEADQR